MRIKIDPKRSDQTFATFADNPSLQESAQRFSRGLPVVEMLQAMSMNEHVLRAFSGLASVYPCGTLERSLAEKVILRVSQLHECQFCVNSHLDMMRGLSLETDLNSTEAHSVRERLAISYAEAMTRDAHRIPETLFTEVHAQFSDAELVELTFLVGLITMLNRFNNALGVHYSGEFVDVEIRT